MPDPTPTPTAPDWRALCQELLQPLAEYDGANPYREHRDLITRTRAALATPPAPPLEPRGCPTPGACSCPTAPIVPPELIRALQVAEEALADIGDAEREPGDDLAWAERRAAQDLPRVRRALRIWRDHATPPATTREAGPLPQAGAVSDEELEAIAKKAEVINMKNQCGLTASSIPGIYNQLHGQRIAGLRAVWDRAVLARWGGAAVPVPVSERPWERPGWCDAEGQCWRFDPCENGWWSYGAPLDLMGSPRPWTHMAPHWALPVPAAAAGEVE